MFGHPKMLSDRRSREDTIRNAGTSRSAAIKMPGLAWRRALYLMMVVVSGGVGVGLMYSIFLANGINALEIVLLVLFSINFLWIAQAFCNACIGFVLQLFTIDPLSLKQYNARDTKAYPPIAVNSRNAVVMPVYNEDVKRVVSGLEANIRSLEATGYIDSFDFYLLSDTQDPRLIEEEARAWPQLQEKFQHLSAQLFYRRRDKNHHKKVGNLADFCQRWGNYYESMIVLDADSLMSGECMIELARTMDANPNAALLQTVPLPVRQKTFFGRFLQFAAHLHSPVLATGMAFWQGDCANYWGHNAIIRIQAFIDNCGLPSLPGPPPFGGEILSHDFVESALLRRGKWHVYLLAHLGGSYEEVPSNLIDYLARDRRWAQGNIQHLPLLTGKSLHFISRLHFLLGALAYVSSLIWLAMLVLSTVDAVVRSLNENQFFHHAYQLFPAWPVSKGDQILSMVYITAALLLLPKLLATLLALVKRRSEFGGAIKLCKGSIVEMVFAIVLAPVTMVYHAYIVICVLLGRKVQWAPQSREGRLAPWRQVFALTLPITVLALAWALLTFQLTPQFFWWLLPVFVGLVLAAPIIRFSSSLRLGETVRHRGVFLTDEHTMSPAVLQALNGYLSGFRFSDRADSRHSNLQIRWRAMPVQGFW